MQRVFLPHPITRETVRQCNRLGYSVVDSKFQPQGYVLPDEVKNLFRQPETTIKTETETETAQSETTPKRKGRPPKNATTN